jgi:hypothetical protein
MVEESGAGGVPACGFIILEHLSEVERTLLRAMPIVPLYFDSYSFLQKPFVRVGYCSVFAAGSSRRPGGLSSDLRYTELVEALVNMRSSSRSPRAMRKPRSEVLWNHSCR